MARRKRRSPASPQEPSTPADDPDRELDDEEFDWLFERLWRAAAWHSGFGRATCERAVCRRARFCAGPRRPPTGGGKWAGPPACVTWQTHAAINRFLHDWGRSVPEQERVTEATFRTAQWPGGPTPLDPEKARRTLAQWLSDGTLIRPSR